MLKVVINLILEQRGMLLDEICEEEFYLLRLMYGKKLGNEYVMFEESFLFYGDDSNNDKKYLFIVGVLYEFFSRILGVEYVNDLYEVLSF